MISLLPTGSPNQTSDAYALLAIIANPDAAKKRLDELVAEKTAAQEAMESARAATKEAADNRTTAEKTLAEAKRRGTEMDAAHAVRARQLSDHEAVLSEKQTRLDSFETQVSGREKDVVAREAALKAREGAVAASEQKAKVALDEAEQHRQFHEDAAQRARALLGGQPKTYTMKADAGSLSGKMSGPG